MARQDERISYLFLVNVTQVLEPVVWSLTVSGGVCMGFEISLTRKSGFLRKNIWKLHVYKDGNFRFAFIVSLL